MEENTTMRQQGVIDIYRTFHPVSAEYTFFSSTHRTHTKIDPGLLNKPQQTEKCGNATEHILQPLKNQTRHQ